MIVSAAFSGKNYAVLGLARSGLAAVETLLASGASVTAWDRQEEPRAQLEGRARLADLMEIDLSGFDGIVVSPGVPLNSHPIADAASKAGVPVIGDIELFALARPDLPPHKVVGITGTNGKSTTTALVHHICQCAGLPSMMAGNIGLPILGQDPLSEGGVYVLELSSYQIDLTRSLDCDVAVLLNVTPDHLDRYDDFAAYRASKFRLFEMQSNDHSGIIASADPELDAMRLEIANGPGQWSTTSGDPYFNPSQQSEWPALQGPHNAQNAWAALAVALELGIDYDVRMAALRSFQSLPHRMEHIAEHNGVAFVNDSKATNPESTAPALAAYPPSEDGRRRLHWIVGGLPKGDDLGECEQFLGNIAAAYTIGEAGPHFAEILAPVVPVERCELLQEAVRRAIAAAQPGDVVLFSPACASFDQFRNFEFRGDAFRQIVEAMSANGDPAR